MSIASTAIVQPLAEAMRARRRYRHTALTEQRYPEHTVEKYIHEIMSKSSIRDLHDRPVPDRGDSWAPVVPLARVTGEEVIEVV